MNDRFELPPELTIYNALQTHGEMLAWVTRQAGGASDEVKVCARAVSAVDGAGLQLLASLGKTSPGWTLVGASPAFMEACRVMGLTQWLEAPRFQPDSRGEST